MEVKNENIIPVDISELDAEILEIEQQISKLQAKREELQLVRRYAMNKAKRVSDAIPLTTKKLSEFILSDLKIGNADGSQLLSRYAMLIGQKVDSALSNRFGNTLFRLKTDELIDGKPKGASRRFGTEYSITKKGLEHLQAL